MVFTLRRRVPGSLQKYHMGNPTLGVTPLVDNIKRLLKLVFIASLLPNQI